MVHNNTPTYDDSTFVNEGPFFDLHPDVMKNLKRFESYDLAGNLIESWERNDKGEMIDVTKRDKLREEIIAAQEALDKFAAKEECEDE